MKTYNKFPEYYDEIIRGNGYDLDGEVEFLSEIFEKYGKGKDILEFACGTGTIARELEKNGYRVRGIDMSEEMIIKANDAGQTHRSAPTKDIVGMNLCVHPEKQFTVGDMTSVNLEKEYDVVLCNYNSVCHLNSWKEWQDFFQNAYIHLKKDGILVFDILTIFEFENIVRDFRGFFNIGKDSVCLEMFQEKQEKPCVEGNGKLYKWLIKMFVQNTENNYTLVEEEISEISFPIKKIKKALEGVGFKVSHMEDFHHGELDHESERVYFVAKK